MIVFAVFGVIAKGWDLISVFGLFDYFNVNDYYFLRKIVRNFETIVN